MTHDVPIRVDHIEAAINYLEGLGVILLQLRDERRGFESGDPLVAKLEALTTGVYEWSPLRYQVGVGMGWEYVAANVATLRRSLGEYVTDAP